MKKIISALCLTLAYNLGIRSRKAMPSISTAAGPSYPTDM